MESKRGRWLPEHLSRDARLLLTTRALRGLGDGALSVLLPSYLTALGYSSFQIGVIVFGTLLGSAALTLWAGLISHRLGKVRVLLGAAALMFLTGLGFARVRNFWLLLIVAFVGTFNPSGGDVSLFLPLEQSAVAETVESTNLTACFALYNVGGAFAAAIGALLSGLPVTLAARFKWNPVIAQSSAFLAYSAIAVAVALLYCLLSPAVESAPGIEHKTPLGKSRPIVLKLAATFSLDSFGGGFVVQSLLALWLFRRFGLSVAEAGSFFFAAGVLGSLSQFVSAYLANRFGRINTMAFTHIPANACLIAAAIMPDVRLAILFLLLRASMSQMDVPARQSYVMAMVAPEERAAAASVTNVPRSLASAMAPLPAGLLLDASNFGWPLVCAGGLKLVYDFLLLAQFRTHRPADEQAASFGVR